MFLDRRAFSLCLLFLTVLPVGFAEASKLKTEISPEVLDLKITLEVRSMDAFEELLKEGGFDQQGVGVAKSDSAEQTWRDPRFKTVSVLLPRGCSFLETLTEEGGDLAGLAQVPDQITFNDVFAGLSYCARHSRIKKGSRDFERDFVSQETFQSLHLSMLGLQVSNKSDQCRLTGGVYSYDSERDALDCLERASWYSVEVYDHVYRDMNRDGKLDLVLFVSVNGAWSGPPDRLVAVLTRTSSGGRWQVINAKLSGIQRDDSAESTEFQTKEIHKFAFLEDFETVEAFQEYIDEYVQSCIDSTSINTKTIPCFVSYELWDRELNKYYQQLQDQFTRDERALLLESQRLWIKDRDRTMELNSSLLDWRYEGVRGTMFNAMRAGDADESLAPMVRQRALLLKRWAELRKAGQLRDIW
ncbi:MULTISPECIES: lysozyme inhibitor LprI family protein [Marinobacter]|uniref:lysozyme inhibitor LprI family protein n=1 Tax=Marinobacter TaxID=2742 RepID=UPI003B43A442|nr:lysozyme inhibitor LprI family protein [Marinobacter alkaliphilus]